MAKTGTKAVRCRCKNRDRHFGVCKCHRHKGDTVAQIELPPARPRDAAWESESRLRDMEGWGNYDGPRTWP